MTSFNILIILLIIIPLTIFLLKLIYSKNISIFSGGGSGAIFSNMSRKIQDKIEFKDKDFIGEILKVPFISKKEYFCLISLFENMWKYMYKWSDGEWMFK